jgi:hypothetical protein
MVWETRMLKIVAQAKVCDEKARISCTKFMLGADESNA